MIAENKVTRKLIKIYIFNLEDISIFQNIFKFFSQIKRFESKWAVDRFYLNLSMIILVVGLNQYDAGESSS